MGAGDLNDLSASCLRGEHSHPLSSLSGPYTTVAFRKINFSFPNLPFACILYTSTDQDPSTNLIRNLPSMVKVTGIPWSTAGLEVGLEDQVRLRGLQVFTLNKRSQVVLQLGECPGWNTPLLSY